MKKSIVILGLAVLGSLGLLSAQDRTVSGKVTSAADGSALPGCQVALIGTAIGTTTDAKGLYSIRVPGGKGTLVFSFIGFKSKEVVIGLSGRIDVQLEDDPARLEELSIAPVISAKSKRIKMDAAEAAGDYFMGQLYEMPPPDFNTESYSTIHENIFLEALRNPLSTFSIDVDAASYSNVRRFINGGQLPPKDAVRIEELVNYFDYDYQQPRGEHPFAVITEISSAPWNLKHKLVHIGLQGKKIPTENLPPSNLVFLLDVSGSMDEPNKLPLLKASFRLLVEQLRQQDHVAIVVYAGAAGLVLPPTSGADKKTILDALDKLEAGGSTAGGAGIKLAYAVAKQHFRANGNNRVILATDGDFNIGESSDAAMERLIEEKREDGIFLTVLGFGMGNYKDSKMEVLADKGNGNYAYIDNILEAQKVLVNEFGGTLFTIAKDVKLQVEFNPAKVQAYRLIGYENRMLKSEDFNNDKKDAGELGSGHTVTALYEIIPAGVESEFFKVDKLKYQTNTVEPAAYRSPELMTVKFRYKKPDEEASKLMVHALIDKDEKLEKTSDNFRWSAAVAAWGMILRESEFVGRFTMDDVLQLAKGAASNDDHGYRAEFIGMIRASGLMAKR
jgi:Ca-activated chloride channel family protein